MKIILIVVGNICHIGQTNCFRQQHSYAIRVAKRRKKLPRLAVPYQPLAKLF